MESGVYRIINKLDGKCYVGSAVDIERRKREHFSDLRNNKHHSIYLQRAFNRDGENNFDWEIIENCEIELLILVEQWYLDHMKPEYNICKIAGSCLGYKHTEESKQKMSELKKGVKKPPRTQEHCKNISIAKKGINKGVKKPPRTQEHCKNISIAKKGKNLGVDSPLKKSIIVTDTEKCIEYIFESIKKCSIFFNDTHITDYLTGSRKIPERFNNLTFEYLTINKEIK